MKGTQISVNYLSCRVLLDSLICNMFNRMVMINTCIFMQNSEGNHTEKVVMKTFLKRIIAVNHIKLYSKCDFISISFKVYF